MGSLTLRPHGLSLCHLGSSHISLLRLSPSIRTSLSPTLRQSPTISQRVYIFSLRSNRHDQSVADSRSRVPKNVSYPAGKSTTFRSELWSRAAAVFRSLRQAPSSVAGPPILAAFAVVNESGPVNVVWAIIVINVMVHFAWRNPTNSTRLAKFMEEHFCCSPFNVFRLGRWHTLVTSVFSHSGWIHLLFNCLALTALSGLLLETRPSNEEPVMSANEFIAFYLGTGIGASLLGWGIGFLLGNQRTRAYAFVTPGLGASGALLALLGVIATVFPHAKFYVFPIPAALESQTIAAVMATLDVAALMYERFSRSYSSGLGHSAHLGGLLLGLLYGRHVLKPRRERPDVW